MPSKRLTDRFLATAKVRPGERVDYWDTIENGLGYRLSDSGVGVFQAAAASGVAVIDR